MRSECYISVDVESSGPIPGKYSMLALGACVVDAPDQTYYVELKPISNEFVAAALEVSGLDPVKLTHSGVAPREAMISLRKWIEGIADRRKPVFVGFNATYDWQFVNWYFHTYLDENPFGFGGIDIKSYFMGLGGTSWGETTSSRLPSQFQPDKPGTHNALDDAQAQASIFLKLARWPRPAINGMP